jgi:ferritin-like metal-binding protein YciE
MKLYITEALRSASSRSSDYNLSKLFINQLREIIWAERLIMKAIPKIITNISSPNLISIMTDLEADTKEQIERLEKIFELINVYARGKKRCSDGNTYK